MIDRPTGNADRFLENSGVGLELSLESLSPHSPSFSAPIPPVMPWLTVYLNKSVTYNRAMLTPICLCRYAFCNDLCVTIIQSAHPDATD